MTGSVLGCQILEIGDSSSSAVKERLWQSKAVVGSYPTQLNIGWISLYGSFYDSNCLDGPGEHGATVIGIATHK